MNIGRVWVIARNVFREAIRDRVLYLVGLFAVGLAASATLLPFVAASTESKILLDVGLALIQIVGWVIAIFVGTGLINKEIDKRTVHVLIAKPVSTVEFIVGKHLGLSAVLAVLVAAMTVIFFAVLTVYQVPAPLGSLVVAMGFIFLELSLVTALAIVFGVFTSTLLATLLTAGVYLMGLLSRDLLTFGNLSKIPAIKTATEVLYVLLPDLTRLNLKNQAVYGPTMMPPVVELVSNGLYGIVYTALLLAIAIVIFSRRQF